LGLAVSNAQGMTDEQESFARCRRLAQSVMERISGGDDRAALELLRPNIPISKADFDISLGKTLKERQALTDRLGKIVGVKLVREERVSDFLYRITYAEKRERHLLRWQFTFYRPQNQWMLNAFNWDDRAMLLFDDGHPN